MDRATRSIRADLGWLLLIVAAALFIRIYFPWPLVFTPTRVNLLETDAWYHLRVIENLVAQFPHRLGFDPYATPEGQFLQVPVLFDWLVAGAAWLLGLGHPSASLVQVVVAFAAPVFGALTVVGVYVAARLTGGSLAGLLAAALVAILPGHFLDRTVLGFADHHALESCVSTWLLCLAVWPLARRRPVIASGAWLGVGLILFRLTWTSDAMIVAVLAVWLLAHVTLQSWRPGGIGDVTRIAGIAAAIAAPFAVFFWAAGIEPFRVNISLAVLGAIAAMAGATELGRYGLRAGWWSPRRLLAFTLGAAAVCIVGSALAFPTTAHDVLIELRRFKLTDTNRMVSEARPLYAIGDGIFQASWLLFRSGFVLGLLGLAFLGIRWIRRAQPADLLLIVWTAAVYAAAIGVNRFGYYLVPAIAIVGGCLCAASIEFAGRAGGLWRSAMVVVVAAGAFGVNLVPALSRTTQGVSVPIAWFPAFDWIREHTPEPFGDPGYYSARYDAQHPRTAASTVMVWWDYGYELMAVAHRVPVAIPTGYGADTAAKFFTAVDEDEAMRILDSQRARHVWVDEQLPITVSPNGVPIGKVAAMAAAAQVPPSRDAAVFLLRQGNHYRPIFLFFESFYKTMAFRLGVLGGKAVVPAPNSAAVVSWTIENVEGFGPSWVISSLAPYPDYDAATAALKKLGPGNHAIVGRDPRTSAVPLEAVRGLTRVYATLAPGNFRQGAVQVFERR